MQIRFCRFKYDVRLSRLGGCWVLIFEKGSIVSHNYPVAPTAAKNIRRVKTPSNFSLFFPFSILFQKGAKKYLHTCPLTTAKVIIYNVDDICVAFSASSLIVVVIWMETLLFMCKSNFDDAPPFQSGQLRHASAWSGATQRGKLIYILIW